MNTTDHIIKSYDTELARLSRELLRMGEMAVAQLQAALALVRQPDKTRTAQIVAGDADVNWLEREIDTGAVRLLALRAPMAGDLRQVFATLRSASDIERIGDCAVGIARRSTAMTTPAPEDALQHLEHMAGLALDAVREALAAWRRRDTTRARHVWGGDDPLDKAWAAFFGELLAHMHEDPEHIATCTHLLFIAKHIERVGDHATNMAEHVWYAVKGETLEPAP